MGSCVAFNCSNSSAKKVPGITFHGFPKQEERRKLWIIAVRRENWELTKHSKLCSKHFPEEMIDRTSLSCVRLRENAVPLIFDFRLQEPSRRPFCMYCLVPGCKNTSWKTPDKVFFVTPVNEEMLKKWCIAMRWDEKKNLPNSRRHVCEDHFDLENDMENYMRYKLTGCKKILKKNVVPHKFECQKSFNAARQKVPTRQQVAAKGQVLARQKKEENLLNTSISSLQKRIKLSISLTKALKYSIIVDKENSECLDSNFTEPEVVVKEEPIDCTEDPTPSVPGTMPTIKETFTVKTEPMKISNSVCLSIFEPKVVIKKEPMDNTEIPTPSISDHDFILQSIDSCQSSNIPIIENSSTVVKVEPVEETEPKTFNNKTNLSKSYVVSVNGTKSKRKKIR